MQILEDLYVGEVRPGERIDKPNKQYNKALDETIRTSDALIAALTDEQKKLFEDFMDAQREVNILTDVDTFIYSFRLGAKIMMDVLTDSTMKEI